MKTPLSLLFIVTLFFNSTAQELKPCATDEYYFKAVEENPDYAVQREKLAQFEKEYVATPRDEKSAPKYIIPVVFHVLHDYGPELLTDKYLEEAIEILNTRYNKTHSGLNNIVDEFKSLVADIEVEFRLAKKDPNGNCHTGIDRIQSNYTYNAGAPNTKLNPWPSNKYLNIWTAKEIEGNVIAFATYPGGNASQDGVMTLASWTKHSTLAHEVGHWLNLLHVWGYGTNGAASNCSADDGVTDTPKTVGSFGCSLTYESCNSLDNIQNIMEYTDCRFMFTEGQKTRMHVTLNSGVSGRNNVWSNANLIATGTDDAYVPVPCTPIADFVSNKVQVCTGTEVSYSDIAWKGTPTSWNWSFPGGTPPSSTDSMPKVSYAAPGKYDATLTVGNAAGTSNPITKTAIVEAIANTAKYADENGYTDDFDNSSTFAADWQVIDAGGQKWTYSNSVGFQSNSCVMINNLSNTVGAVDELMSPAYNLDTVGIPADRMYFQVAYAQKDAGSDDRLEVYYSINCGESWIKRKSLSGAGLATVAATTSNFIPSSENDWKEQFITFGGAANEANVLVKFVFTAGSNVGNNVYIDMIEIPKPLGINEVDASYFGMEIFPNPAEESSQLSFFLQEKATVEISLFDLPGKKISVLNKVLSAGDHNYPINPDKAGIYFVQLTIDGYSFTKKLVVQ